MNQDRRTRSGGTTPPGGHLRAIPGGAGAPPPTEPRKGGGGGGGGGSDLSWQNLLTLTKHGYAPTIHNMAVILRHDARWNGIIRWDEFATRASFVREPPMSKDYYVWPGEPKGGRFIGHEIDDKDSTAVSMWLEREWNLKVTPKPTYEAIQVVAHSNPVHPVKQFLDGITWDGVHRLGALADDQGPGTPSWLTRYMGAQDTTYTRIVGRWWLISAMARIYQPGCKVDHMMVLEGLQGPGKSYALRALFNPWFTEDLPDINSKDALQQLQGIWCVEVAEMDAILRGGVNSAKRFISKATDRFRAPYGRVQRDYPRSCVFCGTTNENVYLGDTTGNRRYWPVRIAAIDIEKMSEEREQLFAEALLAYRAGEIWWPKDPRHVDLLSRQQDRRLEQEPWLVELGKWLRNRHNSGPVSEAEGLRALNVDASRWDKRAAKTVAICYKQLGLVRFETQDRFTGKMAYVWDYPDAIPADPGDEPPPPPPPPAPHDDEPHELEQQAMFDDDDWREMLNGDKDK